MTGRGSSGPGFLVRVICLSFLLSAVSCRKDPPVWEISNLNGDRVLIFGHGGMGYRHHKPMNSASSLEEALDLGADGVEMDLQVSADSVLMLYHDHTLEESTTCDGEIAGQHAAGLADCRYQKDREQHPLISADDFFSGPGRREGRMYTLDCKLAPEAKGPEVHQLLNAVCKLITRHRLAQVSLIESQNVLFLAALEERMPELETYYYCAVYSDALSLSKVVPITGLTMSMDRISAEEISDAHRHGLKVSLFSMATEHENLSALRLSPDQVQTDRLSHMLEAYKY